MKRPVIFAVAALMAAASVCAMAGCGSKTETAKAGSAAASAVETTAAAGGEASQAAAGGSVTEADGIATINGIAVELNGDAAAVVDQLGEYTLTSQTTCHGTEGDDKTYTYEGFVVNTYPLDGEDRVLEIVIKSADIPTSKGIKVGDTVEAVKAAYGEGKSGGMYVAYDTAEKKSVQFVVENGVVTEIDYYYDV